MENTHKSVGSNALYFGVLLGLAYIIYSLITYIIGMSADKTLQYLGLIILAVFIFMASKTLRDKYRQGFLSYGSSVGNGVLTAFIGSAILAIYIYVFYTYIDPDALKVLLDAAEQEMYKKGMDGEQLDMAMSYTKKFMQPGPMAGMSVLGNTFWGTIISLIVSIFIKKEQKI